MAGESIVAKRLCEARLRSGLSQKKLGVLAGMDEFSASPRVNQYERGKHVPDLGTIERIASVLGIPSAYFYAVDDDLAEWIFEYSRTNSATRRRLIRMLRRAK